MTRQCLPMAEFGHKWSFTWTLPNVWLLIRNPTFEPIAAAQNDLFVTHAGFAISKRKQLMGMDFVASDPKETLVLLSFRHLLDPVISSMKARDNDWHRLIYWRLT